MGYVLPTKSNVCFYTTLVKMNCQISSVQCLTSSTAGFMSTQLLLFSISRKICKAQLNSLSSHERRTRRVMSRRPSEKVLPSACFEAVQVSVIHAESQVTYSRH